MRFVTRNARKLFQIWKGRKEMSLLEKKPYTYDQFTAIRRIGYWTLTFSPDGSQVAYSADTSGQFNLWRQSSRGGFPHQLTTYHEQTVEKAAWSPDGEWIAYTADNQGDEFFQVFAIPASGGQAVQLTNAAKAWHEMSEQAWSPDGRYLGYSANDLNPAAKDVLVHDLQTNQVKRVLSGGGYYNFCNWAPDSHRLVAFEFRSMTDTDLHLVDIRDGQSQLLTGHSGEVKNYAGPWKPDGSGFYMRTDEDREYVGIAYLDMASGEKEWVETPEWDIEVLEGSDDGRYLAWVVNEQGYSKLQIHDLVDKAPVPLPALPKGVIYTMAFSPDASKVSLLLMRPTHCTEVFVLDLLTGELVQLTHSMLGGIDETQLISPDLISFQTFDDREIPAWLYRPACASPTQQAPAILSIHGGPEWQEVPGYAYSGMYQYWLSRGIGVLAPNIRGSTGYGKTYQKLIHHDWGGGELKDIEAAAQYLQSLDWVDNDRIGIFGASYGGFATLSAVSRLPDYWAAAVDIFGPSNLVTLIENGPPHWRKGWERMIGDPEKDFDFLMSRSPVTYADQIKTPLFIIQGANDQRVPQDESDQIVARLRERGIQVRYDVYEDEGHGFTKRENEHQVLKDTSVFFEKYLLGEP
jgi:dipeptidyl aminopeptidase/acylaminoacyl peptidase